MFLNLYRVYFGILPSSKIINCVAPGFRHVTGGTEPKQIELRMKAQEGYIKQLNKREEFYIKLEKSVRRYGIQNPIVVQAGFCIKIYQKYLPPEMREDHSKILCCDRKGGSRLWTAQQLGPDFAVPCIISDFSGMFEHSGFKEILEEKEVDDYFKNSPKEIIFNDTGVNIGTLPHTHLDENV